MLMRLRFLIWVVVVITMTACKNTGDRNTLNAEALLEEENTSRQDSLNRAKELKILSRLIGKEVISINDIIPDFDKYETKIVFVTSRFDCISCIDAGFDILMQIREINPNIKTFATGITKEINYSF